MTVDAPPLLTPPGEPGFFTKHWKKLLGCGCLTVLAGGAVFLAAILLVVVAAMKSSDAFKESLARAQSRPEVTEALGAPLAPGLFVGGNVNRAGASGDARIDYSISGPKGEARVFVEGVLRGGEWRWSLMQVKLADGRAIDLIEEPPPPPEQVEAPPKLPPPPPE